MKKFLGIDAGSVSTKFAVVDDHCNVIGTKYLRTQADLVGAIKEGAAWLADIVKDQRNIASAGTTGSGRELAGMLVGADLIKNEITCHAVAAILQRRDVRTVLEIGGQDSKIIVIRDGVVVDFGMNTICAAGTGSFLEQQCHRMGVPIEEFGQYALMSNHPASIAGRCTVFAETDMIHKQQQGRRIEDIIAGLCQALVRNYLGTVARGKEILEPILFQGGVAANIGIVDAFKKSLSMEVVVPAHFREMGALGAALLAREHRAQSQTDSAFCGIRSVLAKEFTTEVFVCGECEEECEMERYVENGREIALKGGRCGKWECVAAPENRFQTGLERPVTARPRAPSRL